MKIANERTPGNPRGKREAKKMGNQHMVQGRIHLYQKGLWGMKTKEKEIRSEGNQKPCPPTRNQIQKEPNREKRWK
jgi:hypothetical protein